MKIPEDIFGWNGCNAAIIGIGVRCGQPDIAVYDCKKLVQVFIDDGMTEEEAEEWIDYNINGQWIGEATPIVVYSL